MNLTKVMSSNSTTIEEDAVSSEDAILGPEVVWTFLILRTIQAILSTLGNLGTIIAVFKFEFLQENSACRLVAALGLADFFGGVTPIFGAIARRLTSTTLALNMLCYVQVIFSLLGGYGNVYCTLLCTIDRYIFITRPLRYFTIVTPQRALKAILVAWGLIIFQIVLKLSLSPYLDAAIGCKLLRVLPKAAYYETLAQYILITFCVVVPIYGVIGYTSSKLSKTEPDLMNYPPEAQALQKAKLHERKMAKTIGLVLGTYLTCYMPLFVYNIITGFIFKPPAPFAILLGHRIMLLVYYMQGILNPFIYSWKNVHFKKAYRKLLCRKGQPWA